jgi:4a-hydroxytetrahydrobiopterin dehydratase
VTRPALLDEDVLRGWMNVHPLWRVEDSHLVRDIATVDYPSGARLITAQVQLAESLNHHPDVTLGYRRVRFEVWTHDQGGLTQLDLDYADGLDIIIEESFAEFIL